MRTMRNICIGSVTVLVLALSACGGSEAEGDSAAAGDGGAASLKDGSLDVFADGAYPPYAYLEEGSQEMVGMEVDMLNAISEKLGAEVEFQNLSFDAMIPGIATGRADVMVMGMADTEERRQQVDFIDLYRTSYRVVTRTGNPTGLSGGDDPENADPMNLCGHSMAAAAGGQQEQAGKYLDEQCQDAGEPGIEVQVYAKATQEYLAVKTGRADFNLMVPANANFFVEANSGDYEMIEGSFPSPQAGMNGWIFKKDDRETQDAVGCAIIELIDEGTWTDILAEWGVSEVEAVIPPLRNQEPFSPQCEG
jgi:polar amino acid transport system substrate-binding protein